MTNILAEPAERSSNSKLDIFNCQNSPTFSEFNPLLCNVVKWSDTL